MTNEIVTQKNEVTGLAGLAGIVLRKNGEEKIGAGEALSSSIYDEDRIIPKIRLQQRTAHNFINEVMPGNFLNSVTGENLGPKDQIIIINSYKIWETYYSDVTPREWIKSELMTIENADLPFEEKHPENGRPINRRNGIYFTCLRVKDVKMGLKRPFIVDFFGGNTSKPTGRQIVTTLKELDAAGANSFAVVFDLGIKQVETDNGPVFAKTAVPVGATPEQWHQLCIDMYKELKSDDQRILMDERDLIKETPTDVTPVQNFAAESENDWMNP